MGRNALDKFVEKYPYIRFVIPFIRVPVELTYISRTHLVNVCSTVWLTVWRWLARK
jgi:hypothetical protein